MSISEATSLFDGEIVVDQSGLYTFVHYYEHPQSGRRVIMTGMNHEGEEEYFEEMKQILAECDLVLFENIRLNKDEDQEKDRDRDVELAELREAVFGAEAEEVFAPAFQLFFSSLQNAFGMTKEEEAFDSEYEQPHWFCADKMLLYDENQLEEEMMALQERVASISRDKKYEIVEYVKRAILQMDSGEFVKRHIGEAMIVFYSSPDIVEAFLDVLAVSRDLYCLEEFDRLVGEMDPQVVGIKFGAAHTAHQRELLESRGYVYQSSGKFCNISFEK